MKQHARWGKLDKTFEINGGGYYTNTDTADLFRDVMKEAKKTNDYSAAMAIMILGEATGVIVKMTDAEYARYAK